MSSFDEELTSFVLVVGIIFLKKIFWETKTIVEPRAHTRPKMFEKEISKEQASITPSVSGNNDR